jgi:hypothetical protein
MYFSEILMCVNVLPYLLGKYYQLLNYYKHNSKFIPKFIEKGNSQQSNNNLKIYKKQFSHIWHTYKMSVIP